MTYLKTAKAKAFTLVETRVSKFVIFSDLNSPIYINDARFNKYLIYQIFNGKRLLLIA